MEPIPDKLLSGNRFWCEMMDQLTAAEISPAKYNRLLKRTTLEKTALSESATIAEHDFLNAEDTLQNAINKMEDSGLASMPVCESDHRLVGVITKRNAKKQTDMDMIVREVMTREKMITAPEAITVEDASVIFEDKKIKQLFLIDGQTKFKGTVTRRDFEKVEKKAERKSQTYLIPTISELPAIFEVLQTCPARILEAIGRDDYLVPDTREAIETFSKLDSKTIKGLTHYVYTTVGDWMYDCIPYNPLCRLLLYVEHHIIPKDGEDFYVYDLKLKYRKITKSAVSEEELPEWMIGNCRRLPFSTSNFDIEQILDVAQFLKVSFRWLYNYDTTASFYGYKPEVENLYDIWSLATEPVKKMILNTAIAKLQGVTGHV